MRTYLALGAAVAAFALTGPGEASSSSASRPVTRAAAAAAPGAAPRFVENAGQWRGDVAFAAEGRDRSIVFGAGGMSLVQRGDAGGAAVRYEFDGGARVRPRGESRTRAMQHRFRGGADPVHARSFASVVYDGAWPGVDVRFDAEPRGVEYTLVVQAGADAAAARFRVSGASSVATTREGALAVTTPLGTVTHSRPVAWQDRDGGRSPVAVAFDVEPRGGGSWTYGFALGAHDRTRAVVIDPFFYYDWFVVGGQIRAITTDALGNVFVAGRSSSADDVDQLGDAFDTSLDGKRDAWVARFDPGGALVWATYLGGAPVPSDAYDGDEASGIALTEDGDVVVVGETSSSGFPQAGVPFLGLVPVDGLRGRWIARLSGDGSVLRHAGMLGGSDPLVAAGPGGDAYVAWTPGTSPPVVPTSSIPASHGAGFAVTWVARVTRDGAAARITELRAPGQYAWRVAGLAVDGDGAVHLTGTASGSDALPAAVETNAAHGNGSDAFSMKLDPGGTFLEHALYIGGQGDDAGGGVVLDSAGAEHLIGSTNSAVATFPRSVGPDAGTSEVDPGRAFVAAIPSDAKDGVTVTALGTDRSFGSTVPDSIYGIAIDRVDRVYATVFGDMWRLDPDGAVEAYAGGGYSGHPAPGTPGVLWFGGNRLTRHAEESLTAPDHVGAAALSTDSARFWWIGHGAAPESFVVDRAKGSGPFADVATLDGDATFLEEEGSLEADTLYRYRVRAVTGGVESLRSEVAEVRTYGTMRLRVARSRVTDHGDPRRDTARASGRYQPLDDAALPFDPATDDVFLTLGDSFSLHVPHGDAGWTREGERHVWTGAAFGGEVTLRVDAHRRTFRIVASGMTLPRARLRVRLPAVSLRLGGLAGSGAARRRR